MCYWGTWANYRPDGGKFTPEHIDPTLCTHLIYSFAGLESHNWTMKSLDPWMDLEVRALVDSFITQVRSNHDIAFHGHIITLCDVVFQDGLKGFKKTTSLKYTYPHLKVRNRKVKLDNHTVFTGHAGHRRLERGE